MIDWNVSVLQSGSIETKPHQFTGQWVEAIISFSIDSYNTRGYTGGDIIVECFFIYYSDYILLVFS